MKHLLRLLRRGWYYARYPVWRCQKLWKMKHEEPVNGLPGELDPASPFYVDPEKYGCKPGICTWEYLNALYYQTFPEEHPKAQAT